MSKQRVFLFVVLLVLSSFAVSSTMAQEAQTSYDEITAQYNLVPVEFVPADVQPIVIESPEHLTRILDDLANPTVTEFNVSQFNGGAQTMSAGSADRGCSVNLGVAWFQHDATFYLNAGRVTNVWSRPSLQGVTVGLSLSDTATNWWHTNSAQTAASARAEGTANLYLVIEGGVRLLSQRVGCNVNYP